MLKVGQKVRFTDINRHETMPWCYPFAGQIGTIIKVNRSILVDWGEDSGVEYNEVYDNYSWWCMGEMLEAVDADN